MSELLTITAYCRDTSDTMSRTFSTEKNNEHTLKSDVLEWEKEIPFRKYGLMTDEFIEAEFIDILDELEVEY